MEQVNTNRPTEKMVGALRRFKIPEAEIDRMSFSDASKKLDELIKGARAKQQESLPQQTQTEPQGGTEQSVPNSSLAIISDLMEVSGDIWSRLQKDEVYSKLNELTKGEIYKTVLNNYSKLKMTSIISSQRGQRSGGWRRG